MGLLGMMYPPPSATAVKLKASKARQAAQREADDFAGQPTDVTTLLRLTKRKFYAQAEWTEPGELIDTFCFAELIVRKPKGDPVRAVVDGYSCT